MTFYVESNFFIEIALGQEEAREAEAILRAADVGRLNLAFPVVAVSEPFSTVAQRGRTRRQAIVHINEQIRDLARSSLSQAEHTALHAIPGQLAPLEQRETQSLTLAVDRALRHGRILPLDSAVFTRSVQLRGRYSLAALDALILAAVLVDLTSAPVGQMSYFLTKNKKDFDKPAIRQDLTSHQCMLLTLFADGVAKLPSS